MSAETDRELLELAAKAAGFSRQYVAYWGWNPLENDADAFRLAVKLNLTVMQSPGLEVAIVDYFGDQPEFDEPYSGNPYAATRRAIVRAAAEIGRGMK